MIYMNRIITMIVITAFIGTAFFSFFIMTHENMMLHKLCIATITNRGVCPENSNAFSMIRFYSDFFNGFSSVIAQSATSLFISIVLSIIMVSLLLRHAILGILRYFSDVVALYFIQQFRKSFHLVHHSILLKWFSLARSQNNPAFSL